MMNLINSKGFKEALNDSDDSDIKNNGNIDKILSAAFISKSLEESRSLIHHVLLLLGVSFPKQQSGSIYDRIDFGELVRSWSTSQLLYRFLNENGGEFETITLSQLFYTVVENAKRLIKDMGFHPGDRILILCDPGSDFFISFFTAIFAGLIAVPSYPPWDERAFEKLISISIDCKPTGVLISDEYFKQIGGDLEEIENTLELGYKLNWVQLNKLYSFKKYTPDPSNTLNINNQNEIYQMTKTLQSNFEILTPVWENISNETEAFLQYTSGSTGSPKGVRVIHDNLLSHSNIILKGWKYEIGDSTASWLPPYHDMQLLGTIICSLAFYSPSTIMSPLTFLHNPFLWLKAISKYRCKGSGGPNFAYDLCVSKIPDSKLKELDLSCWELAYCGAEAVKSETLQRFTKKFSQCGFKPSVYYPCYGLAEATLLVTGGNRGESALLLDVDEDKYLTGTIVPLRKPYLFEMDNIKPNFTSKAFTIVSSGYSSENMQYVDIIDRKTKQIISEPYKVGEIWIRRSRTSPIGYWNQPEKTKEIFYSKPTDSNDEYIITGDLGFFGDNRSLFITGRSKDLIIIRGRNIYPPDIEEDVHFLSSDLRKGCIACFSIDGTSGEEMIFVAELRDSLDQEEMKQITIKIQQHVFKKTGVSPKEVLLLKTKSLPKTTSGKIRRFECRQWYIEGKLDVLYRNSFKITNNEKNLELKLDEIINESNHKDEPKNSNTTNFALQYSKLEIQKLIIDNLRKILDDNIEIESKTTFSELGLDSLKSVEMISKLSSVLDREISPTIVFKYSTIEKLSEYLASTESNNSKNIQSYSDNNFNNDTEKIAIVGMSCRFADANSVEDFWKNLINKVDSVRSSSELLDERKERFPNDMHAGFMDDVYGFDYSYFGISGREAKYMDPQQRISLEVASEALVDAGIDINGTQENINLNAGVFVGATNFDFSHLSFALSTENNHFLSTGSSGSIISNRISYVFNFQGPSMTIDTACSSSLVAIHNACQSLRNNECSFALAGGVNVILSEKTTETLKPLLSPSYKCKSFDNEADGYVRGEGVGFLVLKRLEDALKNDDKIYCLIRGSQIYQDGKSNGLTAPNQSAQTSLLKSTYDNCGVNSQDISYIEAHGTGTKLGDPVEVFALSDIFSKDLSLRTKPLLIGSVKSNIGHLEAAAGIAGVIKSALSLKKEIIPPSININNENTMIPFKDFGISVVKDPATWKRDSSPRFCGVSSFGFGGTLAHIVLEESPIPEKDFNTETTSIDQENNINFPIFLSAVTREAMKLQLIEFKNWLQLSSKKYSLEDISYETIKRKQKLYNLPVNSTSINELINILDKSIENQSFESNVQRNGGNHIAFIFPGQGPEISSQCVEYLQNDTFKQSLKNSSEILFERFNLNIDIVQAIQSIWNQNDTIENQLIRVATQIALVDMFFSYDFIPHFVCGHSLGEVSAAYTSGWISHKDALVITYIRANALKNLENKGSMTIARISEFEANQVILENNIHINIASVNSQKSITFSGSNDEIEKIENIFKEKNISFKNLQLNVPYHSTLVDSVVDFMNDLSIEGSDAYLQRNIQVFSTVSGNIISREAVLSKDYWIENMRKPVLFQNAIENLFKYTNCKNYVEISGQPIVGRIIQQIIPPSNDIFVTSSVSNPSNIINLFSTLHARGLTIQWTKILNLKDSHISVPLPKYAWNHYSNLVPEFIENIPRYLKLSSVVESFLSRDSNNIENIDSILFHQDQVEKLCEIAIIRTLHRLHWDFNETSVHSIEDLLKKFSISSQHQKLFNHLLTSVLEKYGIINISDSKVTIIKSLPEFLHNVSVFSSDAELLSYFFKDIISPEISLISRAIGSLTEVLQGKTSALQVLFPDASMETVEYLYEESITSKAFNSKFSDFIIEYISNIDKPVRILEIGAGTAGLTSHIISKINKLGKVQEYMFTDISRLFINHGQKKFKNISFMNYSQLNIEDSPLKQGFEKRYDIVIAANVIHATKRLQDSLRNIKELIVPNGILVFLEVTRPSLYLDLTFGLTDGWWRFEDFDRRSAYPLLSNEKWLETLNSSQFLNCVNITKGFPIPFQSIIAGQMHHNGLILKSETFSTRPTTNSTPTIEPSSLSQLLEENPPNIQSEDDLIKYITNILAKILIIDPESIHPDDKLSNLGVDSLTALELKNSVQKTFNIVLNLGSIDENATIMSFVNVIKTSRPEASPPKEIINIDNHISSLMEEFENDIPTSPPTILAMGIGEAPFVYQQSELLELSEVYYKDKVASQDELVSLRSIFNGSGIDTRRSIVDLYKVDKDTLTSSFEERNKIYIEGSIKIAEKSCRQALQNWGGDPKNITHIVSVSTTGEQIPGLEFLLIEKLGLSSNIERVGVNLMGCFGAIPGLKTACALARLSRKNRVLMVSTEICTPHIEAEPSKENFVGAAIFSDGSGAAIIGCGPFTEFETPIYEILKTQSKAVPNSTDKMGWKVTDEGWKLTLSKEIPVLIHDAMGEISDRLLGKIRRDQIDWALHPGGKAILLASESSLGLVKEQTNDCWEILRMYGNMSSATIMHVLHRFCYLKGVSRKKLLAALAFGPGLSIETALLKRVADTNQQK